MSTASGAHHHSVPQHSLFGNHPSQSLFSSHPSQSSIEYFANAVYYPNSRVYRRQPPSSLSLAYISHIFYASAWPNPDGTISLSDEYADTEIDVDRTQGCISALTNLKQEYPQLQIILSIGGSGQGSAHFSRVAANNTTRHIFARSATELVHQYSFDGVDIDWEHPSNPHEGADYILLLDATRNFLPSPNYTMTITLPASQWALANINIGMASSYVNFINLKAYDFSGPWSETTGHQAQLFTPQRPHNHAATVSGHSAVAYMHSQNVPLRKILLGIPAYGRSFLGADGIGRRYQGHAGQDGKFDYHSLPRPGAQELVDREVVAAYCVSEDAGFVTYDNPETIQMKANFVKATKLGGLFYLPGPGDARGSRSLVETGYNTLHGL